MAMRRIVCHDLFLSSARASPDRSSTAHRPRHLHSAFPHLPASRWLPLPARPAVRAGLCVLAIDARHVALEQDVEQPPSLGGPPLVGVKVGQIVDRVAADRRRTAHQCGSDRAKAAVRPPSCDPGGNTPRQAWRPLPRCWDRGVDSVRRTRSPAARSTRLSFRAESERVGC